LENEIAGLRENPDSQGLKRFFHALMTMTPTRQKQVIDEALKNARKLRQEDNVFEWMIHLHHEYPADIGVLAPALLNLICLEPGQAVFLQAGELHAYLDGVGIELMANSDNVLRGGLTPKHVDVPELLSVLNFEEREIKILLKEAVSDCEGIYPSRAEEFVLAGITVGNGRTYSSPAARSIEIVLCIEGNANITDVEQTNTIALAKGASVLIPAAVNKYTIDGDATFYKASVPV
jgi:mannose-6-phosphate isomerase